MAKSRLKELQREYERLQASYRKRTGKTRLFSEGRAREISLEIERIQEERKAKRSAAARKGAGKGKATKEYNQLKQALAKMQKQGRTMMELPEQTPATLDEIKSKSEEIKKELQTIGEETRKEAEHAPNKSEKRRLEIKAKLDENWGSERDRLAKKLEDIHKAKKKAAQNEEVIESEDLYADFWSAEDIAIEADEPEEDDDIIDEDDVPF